MAINKVYPELRCHTCGNVLQTEEPDTDHVFLLLVKPCYVCAAQQSVQADGASTKKMLCVEHGELYVGDVCPRCTPRR